MSRRRERLNTGRTNMSTARVPHSPIARVPATTPVVPQTGGDGGRRGGGRGSDTVRTRSTIVTDRSQRTSRSHMSRSASARKFSATGGSIVSNGRSRPGSRMSDTFMSRRKELLFAQTQAGTAPKPMHVTRRKRRSRHTRTELLAERKKREVERTLKASERTFANSMGALLDYKTRRDHPEVIAAQAPVSERTLKTYGGAGISNKTRSLPAFLPKDAPTGMANYQRAPLHKSRSELLAARRAEWRPPMSYDFDGDGYVDNLELFIGCRLDTNKDGRIDTAERKQAKALLEEMQANYTFGLDAAGPVMTSYIEHRVSDQPQWTEEALAKLVPPWAITPRRSMHYTAREVDPTRGGHGQPNRRFPLLTAAQKRKERTLGSGPNILEAQAGQVGTGVMQRQQLAGMMVRLDVE